MTRRCSNDHDNPEGFQFCGVCGEPLAAPGTVRCSRGHENPPGQAFCGTCGEALGAAADSSTSTVTSPPPGVSRARDDMRAPAPVGVRRGNGMAVAALVLGIVGVLSGLIPLLFFFAIVLGVLAFVFGLVGRSAAKREPGRSGRGPAIAGAILGVVACALGVVGIVIVAGVFSSVDRALREAAGPAPADSYRITDDSCEIDTAGFAHSRGTITNTSSRSRNYAIRVEFLGPSGTRVGQGTKIVTGLGADQTAQWDALDSVPGVSTVQCRRLGVDNFFNSSRAGSEGTATEGPTTVKESDSTVGTVPSQPGVAASPIVKVGADKVVVTASGTTATIANANNTPPTPLLQMFLTFDVDTMTPIDTANLTTGTYQGRYFLVTLIGGDTRIGALIGQRNGQWTVIPIESRGVPSSWTEGLAFGGPTGIQAVQRDCIPNCAQGHENTVTFNFRADGTLVPSG
jgi:hypothetical protein